MKFQVERRDPLVCCLSIDLIGSTKVGLELPTSGLDRFNTSLVEQIKPHLEKLGLIAALVKFTGDGWLLMTDDPEKVPALCCLATIMIHRFQDEMSQISGIATDRIPSLRQTICCGRDIRVELPDGRKDWVGDSARRATRASGYCMPNEILIDEPVRYFVFRDFNIKSANVKQRPREYQPNRMEEDFPLHILGELKTEVAVYSEAPEYFVYTLGIIGKVKAAKTVAQQVSERFGDEVSKLGIAEIEALQRILRSWNRLMASLPDYSSALEILRHIRAAGLVPDIFTYSTLISKAPDYETAKAWVEEMRTEGIEHDVVTYSTLIDKAPDYETAKGWVEEMRAEGIEPNVFTYSTLISKAPDYETAKGWVEEMHIEGIEHDVVTYSTLIDKAPDYETAKAWVEEMRAEGIEPNVFTYSTLISKAPDYETAKAWVEEMRTEGIEHDVVTYSTLIDKAPDYETAKAWVEEMRAKGIQPNVVTYNTLISKAPDYETAKAWVEEMRAKGIQPNVVTYNTLISEAPDYETAKAWVEEMRAEGIEPNVVIYNTLIDKAADYETAKGWVEEMRAEGIEPDVVTYNTLIDKAADYETAKGWVEEMRAEGIEPNVVTYSTLFSKDLSGKSADDILKWYLAQGYHPEQPVQAAIAAYRRIRRIDQALRLALDYPHLQAARKVIREHEEEALSYFRTISEHDPQHPNADYALGVALMELGREKKAQPHLKKP